MRTPAWKSWEPSRTGDDLWTWQAGRCAMCGRRAGDALVEDHCHATGLVRGFLCRSCNSCEGWSSDAKWDGWRSGDNPAAAIGEFSIHVGLFGDTALSPTSVLDHYSPAERNAWWRKLIPALEAGAPWPTEAPWTDAARRRAEWMEAAQVAAANAVFASRPTSGRAS